MTIRDNELVMPGRAVAATAAPAPAVHVEPRAASTLNDDLFDDDAEFGETELVHYLQLEEEGLNLTSGSVVILPPPPRELARDLRQALVRIGSGKNFTLPVMTERSDSPRPTDDERYVGILEQTRKSVTPTDIDGADIGAGSGRKTPAVQFQEEQREYVVSETPAGPKFEVRLSTLNDALLNIVQRAAYDHNDSFQGTIFMKDPLQDVVVMMYHIRESLKQDGHKYLSRENFLADLELLNRFVDQHISVEEHAEAHTLIKALIHKLSAYDPQYMQQYLAKKLAEAQAAREEREEEARIQAARDADLLEDNLTREPACGLAWTPWFQCTTDRYVELADQDVAQAPKSRCSIM